MGAQMDYLEWTRIESISEVDKEDNWEMVVVEPWDIRPTTMLD